MSTQFMAVARGKFVGPFTFDQLEWMERTGELADSSRVCPTGAGAEWTTWALLKTNYVRPAPTSVAASRAPALPPRLPTAPMSPEPPRLSRGIYIFLAVFLGGLGLHNLYARHFPQGIVQLILTLSGVTMFLNGVDGAIVPGAIVGIWIIIEIVARTTDGRGRLMT